MPFDMNHINPVLTIAGSDCSGGAGIQADLKTIMAHGAYGMSVVTALTAQNTTGVFALEPVKPEMIAAQLDAVFTDIVPLAVKIGMILEEAAVQVISDRLSGYHAKNIVIDPVLVSTSGTGLMSERALCAAQKLLFGLASVLTPNIPEAERLAGIEVGDFEAMQRAAVIISDTYGCAVLCKGGHLPDAADDLLYDGGQFYRMRSQRIENPNTHGTGCTLSSAIACCLAQGRTLQDSVRSAKAYVTHAIAAGLDLGKGNGPLYHDIREAADHFDKSR